MRDAKSEKIGIPFFLIKPRIMFTPDKRMNGNENKATSSPDKPGTPPLFGLCLTNKNKQQYPYRRIVRT